jgi:predicted ABC-type ATPase
LPDPFLLMVAGPNGAGKSTLTQLLRQAGVEFGEYINPDDIARELDGTYDARVAQAQIIADLRREECIEAKRSFSFETVMSHPSKVDVLIRAKAAGFYVQLYFVGTDDPQTNVERVAIRVAKGGHEVPKDRIVARWHRTMRLLHKAINEADEAFVFDNSASGHSFAGPRLVLHAARVSSGRRIVLSLPKQETASMPEWVRRYVLDPRDSHLVR